MSSGEIGDSQAGELQVRRFEAQRLQPQLFADLPKPQPASACVPAPLAVLKQHEIAGESVLMIGHPGPGLGDDPARSRTALRIEVLLPFRRAKAFEQAKGSLFGGQSIEQLTRFLPEYRMQTGGVRI